MIVSGNCQKRPNPSTNYTRWLVRIRKVKGSNPSVSTTSEQALYRLLRLFCKSQSAFTPLLLLFQIGLAALGFDLVLDTSLKTAASIVLQCSTRIRTTPVPVGAGVVLYFSVHKRRRAMGATAGGEPGKTSFRPGTIPRLPMQTA